MSAEILRRAASTMRERAEAATPGPWFTHEEHGRDYTDEGWSYIAAVAANGDEVAATAYPGDTDAGEAQEDAEHIASWHPAVALAVADWLESCAANADRLHGHEEHHALAVASTFLGDAS